MKLKVFDNRLIYYIRVWFTIIKKSLNLSLAYRTESISKLFRAIIIVGVQIILIQAVFGQSEFIVGWSIDEYYLLVGVFNVLNYIGWATYKVNLWRIEEKVIKGEFDFLLLQPSGSIFSAGFHEFFIDDAITAVSGLPFIIFYLYRHYTEITPFAILNFTIALIAAYLIWFSVDLAISSFNFLSVKNGLLDLSKKVFDISKYPIDIWGPKMQIVFYTVFPVAFFANVPVKLLTGVFTWKFTALSLIAAVVFFYTAKIIWHFSLRKYEGGGG